MEGLTMSNYKIYSVRKLSNYEKKKARAQQLAIDWQAQLDSPIQHSWQWCIEWQNRFKKIGRKYGLLREFHENLIC